MDQRIGVDALDRARQRHRGGIRAAASFRRREAQSWTHPLATSENGIAHRLVNGGGLDGFLREKLIQRAIHRLGAGREKRLQIETG